MAQRVNASRCASSREYVTNWSSVWIAATVVAAAGGVLILPWVAFEARRPPSRAVAAAVSVDPTEFEDDSENSEQTSALTPLELRRSYAEEDDAAPVFDARDYFVWYGSAARTLSHVGTGSSDLAATMIAARATVASSPVIVVLRSDFVATLHHQPVAQSQRRQWQAHTEKQLLDYLQLEVPEIALDSVKGTSDELFRANSKQLASSTEDHHAAMLQRLSVERQDLMGLPLQLGDACKTNYEVAKARTVLAAHLRSRTSDRMFANLRKLQERDSTVFERYTEELLGASTRWNAPQQVSVLDQILQAGEVEQRLILVSILERIEGREASEALARRAIFDLDDSVRAGARAALQSRDVEDYAHVLERGASFPFACTTTQATAALRQACANLPVGSQSQYSSVKTAATLNGLACVSRPRPQSGGTWVVDELVKVNHLRNCTMCHPASTSNTDPLRGPIPQPGRELPRVYYGDTRGNFVRADIVYIRQDFSVMLPVEKAEPWPQMQRFDFFVRQRPATGIELADEMTRRGRAQAIIDRIAAAVTAELDHWRSRLTAPPIDQG